MPMQDNEERLKLRMRAKEIILGAGSPITPPQLSNDLETNNHTTERIINEFQENNLIKPFKIGANTSNPITAWEGTYRLGRIDEAEMSKIIEIKKPRENNKK